MEFKKIKLGRLELNKGQYPGLPENPREWKKKDLEDLARSMAETPELAEARGAVVVPYQNGYVVLGGNMRVEAARLLKWEELMCAVLPADTPLQTLKAIVIKDNSSFGLFKLDLLNKDWGEFEFQDIGIKVPDLNPKGTKEAHDDDYDPSKILGRKTPPLTKRGDLIQLGEHLLICGDVKDNDALEKLMGGGKADLLVTDPPYNVDIGEVNLEIAKIRHRRMDQKGIANDNMSDGEFKAFLTEAFAQVTHHIKPGGAAYVWMASSEIDVAIQAFEDAGWLYKQLLIWVKNSIVMNRQDYQWQQESCIYGWKPGAGHYFTDSRRESTVSELGNKPVEQMSLNECRHLLRVILEDNGIATDVLHYDKPSRSAEHPTMKPVPLIGHHIKNSSRRYEVVLDPFGGSGTTLIACEQLERKCRMVELDPVYCDVIVDRWEKLTGQKAIRP